MPPALPESVRARIGELRYQGLSLSAIAKELGISKSVAGKYGKPPSKPPKSVTPARRGRPAGRKHYWDDPRFPPLDEDPYADVVPIPFYPHDLPRLQADPFGWTPAELESAVAHARKKLGLTNARRGTQPQAD